MHIVRTFRATCCVLPFKQINFMKKFNSLSLSLFRTKFRKIAIFALLFSFYFGYVMAQNQEQINCTWSVPNDWGPALAEESEIISKYVTDRTVEKIVPVRFIQVLSPDYANDVTVVLTEAEANTAINNLNAAFAGAGILFYKCGPVITREVNELNVLVGGNYAEHIAFNYSSATMEVYLSSSSVFQSAANPPCPGAYQTGNPNYAASCGGYDNKMEMSSKSYILGKLFIHETGHHLGLLHTFMPVLSPYQTPVGANQLDHPYPVLQSNGEIHPMWWGRELVIRENLSPTAPELFKNVNSYNTGDFVEDTHADCQPTLASGPVWPGCLLTAQNGNTCEIDHSLLTYKDYNDMPIYPAPDNLDFGRNYMSYWKDNCVNSFTPGQYHRMQYFYDTYRSAKYISTAQCGNFADEVRYYQPLSGGQYKKLPRISVRTRHLISNQVCNATTESNGTFNGTLFSDPLLCDVYHNGRKAQLAYPWNDKRCHYGHEICEWSEGVDVADLVKISRYILTYEPLNGYQIIAADANKSGTVSSFDIVQLRKLILGQITQLAPYDQPWRFVPEFIPENYTAAFNYNPFDMPIAGTQHINAALLTDATNQAAIPGVTPIAFQIPAVAGKKGFDAIKIGDVDGSWVNITEPCVTVIQDPNPISLSWCTGSEDNLKAGNEAELVIAAQQFNHVSGFQLGLSIPQDYFDVLDINVPLLPEYTKTDHFGLEQIASGQLKTLWMAPMSEAVTLPGEPVLFELKVKAKQDIEHLGNLIKLDNNVLKTVIVQDNNTSGVQPTLSLCLKKQEVTPHGADSNGLIEGQQNLLKCIPNPARDQVTLTAWLTGDVENGLVQIRNISGQVVFETRTPLHKGENTVDLTFPETLTSGIYTMELLTEYEKLSTRLIKQ